jgi:hypothetical protein
MGNNTSFRASIKAIRNEKILASISKLNIPVGRILLTPDSITYVNYLDKNYFEGDYSFLSSLLNFRLNFNVVQAVISNPVKTGTDGSGIDSRRFYASVEDEMYVLQPDYKPYRTNSEQKRISFRSNKNKGYFTDDELVIRKLMFNPFSFVLEKIVMEDSADNRKLEVDFSDFVKIDGYDYPGAIDINMTSGDELTELNIKLRGFSTEKVDALKLDIPGRYQRIR